MRTQHALMGFEPGAGRRVRPLFHGPSPTRRHKKSPGLKPRALRWLRTPGLVGGGLRCRRRALGGAALLPRGLRGARHALGVRRANARPVERARGVQTGDRAAHGAGAIGPGNACGARVNPGHGPAGGAGSTGRTGQLGGPQLALNGAGGIGQRARPGIGRAAGEQGGGESDAPEGANGRHGDPLCLGLAWNQKTHIA